jgi:hypothetical protein
MLTFSAFKEKILIRGSNFAKIFPYRLHSRRHTSTVAIPRHLPDKPKKSGGD